MPDHLHAVWTMPEGDANFSTRWRLIKESFTRTYTKQIEQAPIARAPQPKYKHRIWQQRFWERLIRDDRELAAHVDDIHLNPVHHNYVSAPRDWIHSTIQTWVERGVYDPAWGSDEKPVLPPWAKKHE
jgi:putative transposase